MLYKIRQDTQIFEDNPEILSIPEFAKLTDRQMKFVALVADRRSPLRTLTDKQRREKVAQIVGYPLEGKRLDKNGREAVNGNVPNIETAIERYREYQRDENAETLEVVNKQIDEIREYLQSDKSQAKDYGKALEQAAKLGERLPGLVEARQKLEALLQISSEQKVEITTYTSADVPEEYFQEGGQDLPAIEAYHMTQQKNND